MNITIIVNATALRSGGGLTILNQFIENIDDHFYKYIIFVHSSYEAIDLDHNIITFVRVEKTHILTRILWDSHGLNQWLDQHKITPDLIISLQNTSVNIKSHCPQLIYLHQAIPFCNIKWSLLKREEFKFFLYKHFYRYFIFKYFKRNDSFIVQTTWMKDALLRRYNFAKDTDVSVVQPQIQSIKVENITKLNLPEKQFSILYPAAALGYKNHIEIINALIYLQKNIRSIEDIKVYFTITKKEADNLWQEIKKNHLQSNFSFLGNLPLPEVLRYYKSVDLVVFPSYLESFGLPLIEAAEFGKPIIVSDLSYAHEILNEYPGAKFARNGCPSDWALAIDEIVMSRNNTYTYIKPENAGWDVFFNVIKKRLK